MKATRLFAAALALTLLLAALPLPLSAVSETPILTHVPQNYCWPEGSIATYYCKAEGDDWGTIYQYEWYLTVNGKTYDLNDPGSGWKSFAPGVNSGVYSGNTLTLDELQPAINGAELYCIVYSPSAWVESPHAIVSLGAADTFYPPEIEAMTEYRCKQNETVTLSVETQSRSGNVSENKDGLSYQWYSTDTGRLQDIRAIPGATGKSCKASFESAGSYSFVCGVFDGADTAYANYSYSNVIRVEVEETEQIVGMEITQLPKKTEYTVGDVLDLNGLKVRVYTNMGFYDSCNGDGLAVAPQALTKAGTEKIILSVGNESATFNVTVRAAELAAPVITDQPVGGSFTDEQDAALEVGATAEPGARLYFQWYVCPDGTIGSAQELPGATVSDYVAPHTPGTSWYVCYVYANRDGMTSAGVPTNVVAVTYPKEGGTLPGGLPSKETEPGETLPTDPQTQTDTEPGAENASEAQHGEKSGGDNSKVLTAVLITCAVFLGLIGIAAGVAAVVLSKKKKK